MIHSQTTLSLSEPDFFNLERSIKYRELNEFAKFVEFKKEADSALYHQQLRLNYLDSVNQQNEKALFQYENFSIPSLQNRIAVKDSTIENQKRNSQLKIYALESEVKRQSSKKWNFGLFGVILGSITTLITIVLFGS